MYTVYTIYCTAHQLYIKFKNKEVGIEECVAGGLILYILGN